ncbi:MAG: 50S ribosomal protein L13 [Candidatus Nealsonbacteria bacterium]|nr:50S ribosomal protein L13 [Candidatus Nealsonbacteria bacterium]
MERNTHTIDAKDQTLGRLATKVSLLLRGKQKPDFAPHKDGGDFVVIENADKIKVTGKKYEQKKYYRHSGYLGGLKEQPYSKVFIKNPGEVLKKAVWGMLPKNKLRAQIIKRLKVK